MKIMNIILLQLTTGEQMFSKCFRSLHTWTPGVAELCLIKAMQIMVMAFHFERQNTIGYVGYFYMNQNYRLFA